MVAATASVWLVCFALPTAQAHATAARGYSFSFGGSGADALSYPAGVAVDGSDGDSSGDVYVTDPGLFRVEKFGPRGDFLLMFGDGVNARTGGDVCTEPSQCKAGIPAPYPGDLEAGHPPGAFSYPAFVAVDSSDGPSAGDVYVGDGNTLRVNKFTPSGELIESWGTGGQLGTFYFLAGIAVDATGDLHVLESGSGTVYEYDEDGHFVSSLASPGETSSVGLAVTPSGTLLKVTGAGQVMRFGDPGAEPESIAIDSYGIGLGMDPTTGNPLVNLGNGSVVEFPFTCPDQPCVPSETLGTGFLTRGYPVQGVAVDPRTKAVYVDDGRAPGGGAIAVFRPGLPDAVTGPASEVESTTMTINGHVDPAASAIVGCRFEYIGSTTFEVHGYTGAKAVDCTRTEFSEPADVSARLVGLSPRITYRYRLVVTTATQLTRTGIDRTATTVILPSIETGPVSNLSPTGVQLSGEVDPTSEGGDVTGCRFEYVNAASFYRGYATATEAPCFPSPAYQHLTHVITNLSGLEPATTYHYRLVARNVEGPRAGADRTFTTPSLHRAHHHPKPAKAVHCSKKACTRSLSGSTRLRTWVSPRFPPRYGWLFGVYKEHHSLENTNTKGGCIGTFRGRGMIATLNGCHGQFKLVYLGTGHFTIRWRVFPHCTCAKETNQPSG